MHSNEYIVKLLCFVTIRWTTADSLWNVLYRFSSSMITMTTSGSAGSQAPTALRIGWRHRRSLQPFQKTNHTRVLWTLTTIWTTYEMTGPTPRSINLYYIYAEAILRSKQTISAELRCTSVQISVTLSLSLADLKDLRVKGRKTSLVLCSQVGKSGGDSKSQRCFYTRFQAVVCIMKN